MTPRPRRRLFRRVSALVLCLLTAALAIPAALTIRSEDRLLRERLLTRAHATAATAALAASEPLAAPDPDTLARLVATLAHQDPDVGSALVADRRGRVLAHSDVDLEGTAVADLSPPPAAPVAQEVRLPDGSAAIRVTSPVLVSGEPWGTVRLDVPLAPLEAEIRAAAGRVVASGIALLALGALGAAWLARSVARPVERLADLAGEVARGRLDARSGIRSQDEVGALAEAFDGMTDELSRASAKLREYATSLEMMVAERTAALEEKTRTLEAKEREIEDLVENARDPIVVIGSDGTIRAANRAAWAESGYRPEELVGRSLLELLAPSSRERAAEVAAKLRRREPPPGPVEVEVCRRDGTVVPVEVSLRALYEGDRVKEVQCVARPIAERRELERRRLEQKQLETALEMAGAAAHHLNQPLTAILGCLRSAEASRADPAAVEKALALVRGEVWRMAETIKKMTGMTRYRTTGYDAETRIAALGDDATPPPQSP